MTSVSLEIRHMKPGRG